MLGFVTSPQRSYGSKTSSLFHLKFENNPSYDGLLKCFSFNLYISELLLGLTEYFAFYNGERYPQALGYKTPDQIYQTAEDGGAMIIDHCWFFIGQGGM